MDLETTGLNSILDEICELAIVVYDKDLILKKEFRSLLRTHNPIPEDVTLIHGITNEMVADKPFFEEVAPSVLKLLQGKVICGHNVRTFDIPFLAEQFFKCDIIWDTSDLKTLDTLSIERILKPRDLGTLYKLYTGKEIEDAHSAVADCKASKEVLAGQIKEFGLDINSKDFNEMLGVNKDSIDPSGKLIYIDGTVCWSFGKNKNKPILEDLGYINWSLASDFPKSTKYYIQKELDKSK